MDGNKKILIIAILMMLIAVSYGTYAIYKTSLSGNATVTAAIWNVSFQSRTAFVCFFDRRITRVCDYKDS
jgi:hypothetical protein